MNAVNSDCALSAEGVAVTYPNGRRALHPCTLGFQAGSFNVLLGASGAGKSTLLRCLNGLVKPTRGQVSVAGINVLTDARTLQRHRQQVGMVFQHHHLIGRSTVLANVLMGRVGFHSTLGSMWPWSSREKNLALAAIERVGLLDHALERADQLSGGQQQRVGVARALVQQPRILLADEPVASLDPNSAINLLTLMLDICRSDGLTAVLSLHQVELARRFADRIIGLKAGAIVFDAIPEALNPAMATLLYSHPEITTPSTVAPAAEPSYVFNSQEVGVRT